MDKLGLFTKYFFVSIIFTAVTFLLLVFFRSTELFLSAEAIFRISAFVFVASLLTSFAYYLFFINRNGFARLFIILLGLLPVISLILLGGSDVKINDTQMIVAMSANLYLSFAFMYFILIAVYQPIGRLFEVKTSTFSRDVAVIFIGIGSLFCATTVSMYLIDAVYPYSLFEYRIAQTELSDVILFNLGQFGRGFPLADILETFGYEPSSLSPNLDNRVFTAARLALNVTAASAFFPIVGRVFGIKLSH